MILQKIKKYLAPAFNPKTKDRGIAPIIVYAGITAIIAGAAWLFGGGLAKGLAKELLYGSGTIILTLTRTLFHISAIVFESMGTSEILQKSITANPTVTEGWAIVRDFCK